MTLNGKHALVTGGGTGIGLAIAQDLAAKGCAVTITGRRQEVLDEVAGQTMTGMAMDVRNEEDVIATIAAAVKARGPIQICVANAGIAEGRALHKTDMAFWRNIMATNLDGAFLTIRECLGSMRQTDWGRVIAVSSIAGLRGLPGAAAYSASKHGMIGLIRSLSEDYMRKPDTFNALCPGYVDTHLTDPITRIAGLCSAIEKRHPQGRFGKPEEIANVILFLASAEASFVTGAVWAVDGGYTAV